MSVQLATAELREITVELGDIEHKRGGGGSNDRMHQAEEPRVTVRSDESV